MIEWLPIDDCPRNGDPFLAWREVPTFDEDLKRERIVSEPCVAQYLWGSVGSIPLHSQPSGQRFTHYAKIQPPKAA